MSSAAGQSQPDGRSGTGQRVPGHPVRLDQEGVLGVLNGIFGGFQGRRQVLQAAGEGVWGLAGERPGPAGQPPLLPPVPGGQVDEAALAVEPGQGLVPADPVRVRDHRLHEGGRHLGLPQVDQERTPAADLGLPGGPRLEQGGAGDGQPRPVVAGTGGHRRAARPAPPGRAGPATRGGPAGPARAARPFDLEQRQVHGRRVPLGADAPRPVPPRPDRERLGGQRDAGRGRRVVRRAEGLPGGREPRHRAPARAAGRPDEDDSPFDRHQLPVGGARGDRAEGGRHPPGVRVVQQHTPDRVLPN